MTMGKCMLCSNMSDLKASHIVPRFVYQWMRSTGGSYFRNSGDPAKRKQDGAKEYLLCGSCEQRFSAREAYFKQAIFDPYINGNAKTFHYDQRLFYFNISIAWRVLVSTLGDKDIGTNRFIGQLRNAESEWRNYLLTESLPPRYDETHLFFTNILSGSKQPVRKTNRYLARAVDTAIAFNSTMCAVYWKFARFASFSAITPFDQSLWIGTRVSPAGGTLYIPQEINDGYFGSYIFDRARIVSEAMANSLTEKQKKFHEERIKSDPEAFLNSDLGKVIKADATSDVDPHILYPKVGRNDPCPCGSGRKYKKCHGQ